MTGLFDTGGATETPAGEQVEEILGRRALRVERIVSRGHASPPGYWYDHDEHEWVAVLSGRARLRFEDEDAQLEMAAGDHVDIPAHRRHRVEWTDPDTPTIWLAVFYQD